jgi:hypothetical protein
LPLKFPESYFAPRNGQGCRFALRRIGDFLKELKLTEGKATGFPLIRDETSMALRITKVHENMFHASSMGHEK